MTILKSANTFFLSRLILLIFEDIMVFNLFGLDAIIMDQDIPKLSKRTTLEPLRRPTFHDFNLALQYRQPLLFKVKKSQAPGAGYGLYFKGSCKAGDLLTGYGGDRKDITLGADSHYSAKIGATKYAMDATRLSRNSKRGNYDRYASLVHVTL